MKGLYIAVGIIAVSGIAVMLYNFVERPDNDSGNTGSMNNRQSAEHHPLWPPENERLSHKMRKWWEW